jgi:glycosyltransferase involved in cell wall biosynthesis
MDRPAVAVVTPDPAGLGGMAAVVRRLLESPLAERYELTPITTHRVAPAWERLLLSAVGVARVARWCLRHRDGLVHVHGAVRGSLYRKAAVILLARALRVPVVFQLHAGPGDIATFTGGLGRLRRALLGAALRRAQVVLAVSAASGRALQECFGIRAIDVIANPAPAPRGEVGPPSGSGLLFLGGFANPVKGGAQMLAALPRLLAADPDLRVVAAGPGEPPPELLELGPRVEWRGYLDEPAKAQALADAAILVIPSTSEGLPIVLLEAMSYGRAVVATRVGGIPDTITDGVDGVLVPPGDVDALVDALLELVRDPARVAALGAAARKRAAAFDSSAVVDRLDALYRALLAR